MNEAQVRPSTFQSDFAAHFSLPSAQFDNRDFSVLPEYQPRGQSIDLQTAMGGNSPGVSMLLAVNSMNPTSYIIVAGWVAAYVDENVHSSIPAGF